MAKGCQAVQNESVNNPIMVTTFIQIARIATCVTAMLLATVTSA
jgi:hypothetical protein